MVHPISQTMMQILGWILSAIMLDGICIMAKAIVYITAGQAKYWVIAEGRPTQANGILIALHIQLFLHAGDV
jgi:hypothetical protein